MFTIRLLPLTVLFALAACTSLETIVVEKNDQPLTDAGGDAAATQACYDCLEAPNDPGPGCANEYKACDDDPKCKAQQACYRKDCSWAIKPTDVFACGSKCFEDLGVAFDDPASLLAYNIYLCATKACGPLCFPTEVAQ